MLTPILDYASLPRWRFPFAPHDLGTYPQANGQVYGGGERTEENQMPVEESGNMLLLVAALAQVEGNADYAAEYWPLLTKWAEYLKDKGFDPENQLSTDDFAGHLAHNANLSIKAILALGAYAQARRHDRATQPRRRAYRSTGRRSSSPKWTALADDGDHYRLAFDKPGTWSQKYNLVWDKLLGLESVPAGGRAQRDRLLQDRAGRRTACRSTTASATPSSTGSSGPRRWPTRRPTSTRWSSPVYKFLNESPSRVPMTDWYWTARRASSAASRPARSSAACSSRCSPTRRCGRSTREVRFDRVLKVLEVLRVLVPHGSTGSRSSKRAAHRSHPVFSRQSAAEPAPSHIRNPENPCEP